MCCSSPTPVNVRYLTGFTGTNGLALIDAGEAAAHRFLTDFRYATQSAAQVPDAFEREIVAGEVLEGVVEVLTSSRERGRRLGFDDANLTVKQHARLVELLGDGVGARPLRRRGRAAAGGQGRR